MSGKGKRHKNKQRKDKVTQVSDADLEADFGLDPAEFDSCQKHFIAVRCGKQEAWESLFELAATKSSVVARIIMTVCYSDSEIKLVPNEEDMVRRFGKSTVEWLQHHVHHKHPIVSAYCRYLLAEYSLQGICMEANLSQAISLLKSSNAIPCALYKLGRCYQFGLGVPMNIQETTKLYSLAADHQHPLALNVMGTCYQRGVGVTKCEKLAATYFQLAANQGLAHAQCNLGDCCMTGVGLGRVDKTEGIKWFQLAARQDCTAALVRLAECYEYGDGVAMNIGRAYCYYSDAKNDPNGQAGLARILDSDTSSIQRQSEALQLFRSSSALGSPAGQTGLATYYMLGKGGLVACTAEAMRLFRLAMDQDHPDAFYQLGCCYKSGSGVDRDICEAIRLLQLASSKGHEKAKKELAKACFNN
jgi:TPR repeat protein